MTIQQLKSFLAVCEDMNYTRAAQKCFISRQALRQNISSLEDELCGILFINNSNRLSLTSLGLKLYNESLSVVESFDRLEDSMLSEIAKKRDLSIGISYGLVPDYLPMLSSHLERFSKSHRSINLKQYFLNNDDIAQMINDGKLDCGLVMDLGMSFEGINRIELSTHKAAVLFPVNKDLKNRSSIDIKDLDGEKLCIPGFGPEMKPLRSVSGIDTQLVPSYYQAYYLVREKGYCAITRFEEDYDSAKDFIQVIPINGMSIFSSFISSKNTDTADIKKLAAFLRSEIAKDFTRL